MITTEVLSQVQLIKGTFTPSEAQDVVNSLIREKINFHKIHRLSICEGDENSDTTYDDSRVSQLQASKEDFKEIVKLARAQKKKIRIHGALEIELID